MATDNKEGKIRIEWTKKNKEGEEVKIVKESPNTFFESAERLMHALNQKSRSGQNQIDFAIKYLTDLRKTRKNLPDSAKMIVTSKTDKNSKSLECTILDYENFVMFASLLSFESETYGEESPDADDDLSWMTDDESETENPESENNEVITETVN